MRYSCKWNSYIYNLAHNTEIVSLTCRKAICQFLQSDSRLPNCPPSQIYHIWRHMAFEVKPLLLCLMLLTCKLSQRQIQTSVLGSKISNSVDYLSNLIVWFHQSVLFWWCVGPSQGWSYCRSQTLRREWWHHHHCASSLCPRLSICPMELSRSKTCFIIRLPVFRLCEVPRKSMLVFSTWLRSMLFTIQQFHLSARRCAHCYSRIDNWVNWDDNRRGHRALM